MTAPAPRSAPAEDAAAPAPVVLLHLWGVPRRRVPAAVARMALGRRALAAEPGLRFAKLLGTGDGRTFTLRDADPRRWGALTVWDSPVDARRFADRSATVVAWRGIADEQWCATLRPVAARGTWAGREPFGAPRPSRGDGPVAALTRARLAPVKALTFWQSVPPVSAALGRAPGLRYAVGIGEAPVGLQGTFSVWDDDAALRGFAYRDAAHQRAIRQTAAHAWYAEELFARFTVLETAGSVDGRDPATG